MSYLQARKDKMKPNSRRGAIFGKEMAQSPKIFAMSSNQVKAPRESFLEEGLDLVASLDPVTQEINIERMTAALQAIVLDPTNLKLAEDELNKPILKESIQTEDENPPKKNSGQPIT